MEKEITKFLHERNSFDNDKTSLHSRMMYEAEPVVKSYWTDVAIHDKRVLNSMEANSIAVWAIGEMGSYLSPLYSRLDNRDQPNLLPTICYLLSTWQERDKQLKTQSEYSFFIIHKGSNSFYGTIKPISLQDLVSLLYPKN